MIGYWKKRFVEPVKRDEELEKKKKELKKQIRSKFGGTLAIRMVDSGSCNACEAECNALSNPYYNLEELGITFVASPRHADVMLLSGVMTMNMYHHAIDCYEQIPSPKWVIAIGDCIYNFGLFEKTYAIKGHDLKIDCFIEGCPPKPADIIIGILEFLQDI
jgi:Ni,Fe-hydrogenase III small subunit